jgi:hypothetical protein
MSAYENVKRKSDNVIAVVAANRILTTLLLAVRVPLCMVFLSVAM